MDQRREVEGAGAADGEESVWGVFDEGGRRKIKHQISNIMSQQELKSYRLSSLQDPTDEMLQAIMEQVAESARRSTAKFQAELHRRFELIKASR